MYPICYISEASTIARLIVSMATKATSVNNTPTTDNPAPQAPSKENIHTAAGLTRYLSEGGMLTS